MEQELRVGVGICTRNRPKCLSRLLMKLVQYRSGGPIPYDIFVADDGSEDGAQKHLLENIKAYEEALKKEKLPETTTNFGTPDSGRLGVAKNKNRILRHFADRDYIVIFEDDAFPVHPDWLRVHIEASKISNIHHFNFVPHSHPAHVGDTYRVTPFTLPSGEIIHIAQTQNITGVFLFYTQKVIQTLGGFDRRFGLYGFEHVELSDRIRDPRICLSPPGIGYPSLLECERYIEWDSSVPTVVSAEEKAKVETEQRKIWDEIREDMFLYRPF